MIPVKISRWRGRLWQKWHDVPGQGRMSGYLPKMVTSFMNSPLPSWQPQHCQYSWKMATQSIFPRKIQTRRRQTCWIAVVLSGYRNILRNFRKVGMCIWHCLIIRVQEIYRPQYQCQKVKAQIGCKVNIFNLTQEEDWEKTWISLTKRKSLSVPFFHLLFLFRNFQSISFFLFPLSLSREHCQAQNFYQALDLSCCQKRPPCFQVSVSLAPGYLASLGRKQSLVAHPSRKACPSSRVSK